MKVSVVCVYNRKDLLDSCLLPGLEAQKLPHERIFMDNTQNRYPSAASALNEGGARAKGEYIVFSHQDMSFKGDDWLSRLVCQVDSLEGLGVAGLAGRKDAKGTYSNMTNGDPPYPAGELRLERPLKVQTLDESILVIPKAVFESHRFDERTCDGWHLYGVDYCLTARTHKLGVYVLPLEAHHCSSGKVMAPGYRKDLEKLLKKHRGKLMWIYSTTGDWHTGFTVRQNELMKKPITKAKKAARKVLRK